MSKIEEALGLGDSTVGAASVTQFGVEFPNGVIHWGDVSDGGKVDLSHLHLPLDRNAYNREHLFFLDPTAKPNYGSSAMRAALLERWEESQDRLQLDEDARPPLRFVQRELVIARGKPVTSIY